jgi:hypothetical protein
MALMSNVIGQCEAVVIEGIMPNHDETIKFAEEIGFIKKTKRRISFLLSGKSFLELNKENIYDLLPTQKNYVLRTCFLHGAFRELTLSLLGKFSPDYNKNKFVWSEIDGVPLSVEKWFIERLIELGLLIRTTNGLEVANQYVGTVSAFLDEGKGWTIEAFEDYLKEKKEVGDIAENAVLDYELARLKNLGCNVESMCIRRISQLRVNAGYDIESFDKASSDMNFDRFIEVKGARSSSLHFFWTDNEMTVAKKLGKRYWIYFQGGIDVKRKVINNDPIVFQDPLNTILKNSNITNIPQGLIIQGKLKGAENSRTIE